MLLQALTFTCNQIRGFEDANDSEITPKFADSIQQLCNEPPATAFIINLDITRRAKAIVEYFNLNKMILSSYSVDPLGSFDDAFAKVCDSRPMASAVAVRFSTISTKILRFMRKAMMMQNSVFTGSKLGNGNLNRTETNEVFNHLQELRLGTVSIISANNSHKVPYFHRISANELTNRIELGQIIQDMGLNLQEVINNFVAGEEREEDVSTQSNQKRDNSQMSGHDLESPPSKKSKTKTLKKSVSASTSSLLKSKTNENKISNTSQIQETHNSSAPTSSNMSNTSQSSGIGSSSGSTVSIPENELLDNESEEATTQDNDAFPQNVPVLNETVDYGIYMHQEFDSTHNINESFTDAILPTHPTSEDSQKSTVSNIILTGESNSKASSNRQPHLNLDPIFTKKIPDSNRKQFVSDIPMPKAIPPHMKKTISNSPNRSFQPNATPANQKSDLISDLLITPANSNAQSVIDAEKIIPKRARGRPPKNSTPLNANAQNATNVSKNANNLHRMATRSRSRERGIIPNSTNNTNNRNNESVRTNSHSQTNSSKTSYSSQFNI